MRSTLLLACMAAAALSGCESERPTPPPGEGPLADDPLVAPKRDLDEGAVAGEGGVVREGEIEE